ncbi:ankyrin repeat-containing domain protein [Phaeosphaeriaceae sp. PMI808]|nr:ankyrin repeat-containing domain protein [Phaeosphaeriaceae sp. PMI808]
MDLHRQYDLPIGPKLHEFHLSNFVKEGWFNMAQHLLQNKRCPDGSLWRPSNAGSCILVAAKDGHCNMVQLLLEHGAKIQDRIMVLAAGSGSLETVQLLLDHNPRTTGAIAAAARRGYGDIVELLLKHGADADDADEYFPAIAYAIWAEHLNMFKCLVQHGAKALTPTTKELLVREAGEKGIVSMLSLLDSEDMFQ